MRHEHTLHVRALHTIMRRTANQTHEVTKTRYMYNVCVYISVSQYMCCVSQERMDQLTLTPYEHQWG